VQGSVQRLYSNRSPLFPSSGTPTLQRNRPEGKSFFGPARLRWVGGGARLRMVSETLNIRSILCKPPHLAANIRPQVPNADTFPIGIRSGVGSIRRVFSVTSSGAGVQAIVR